MALALHVNHTSLVILELAVMLLSAFLLSRLTKRLKLPNVTAYIVAGILIGPCGLKWIDAEMVESMGFVTDVALSFIAFGVGALLQVGNVEKQRGAGADRHGAGIADRGGGHLGGDAAGFPSAPFVCAAAGGRWARRPRRLRR